MLNVERKPNGKLAPLVSSVKLPTRCLATVVDKKYGVHVLISRISFPGCDKSDGHYKYGSFDLFR